MVLGYVAAAYAALTLVLTYPAALHLGDRLIGDGGDGLQFVWNLWWMKRALIDLHTTPFETNAIFYPEGVSLWLHTLTPLNGMLSLPLQIILPLPVVYNLLVLASFVAAGCGAFVLAREETGSIPGAFVGGIVFTFSSFHFAHARGHLNLTSCQWLPLFALFVIRSVRKGGMANGALAGVFLALNLYTDPYYMLYAMLLGSMLIAAYWRQRGERSLIASLVAAGAVGGLLVAPYLFGMIRAARAEQMYGAHHAADFSADLTSYFVPNGVSSYGDATRSIWLAWSGNATENACFIGFSVLVLIAFALRRAPAARPWGVIAAVFFVLSLGPELHVAGRATAIALPYALLQRVLPFLNLAGVPVRMNVMVELCAAVVVAYACREFARRWSAILGSAIIVERLALPYPTSTLTVDAFYLDLARDPETHGVLDLTAHAPQAMYLATVHGKNIVEGMVARLPASAQRFIDNTPVLPTLLYASSPPAGDLAVLARQMCERLKIRYVIAHDNVRRDYVATVLRLPPERITPELTAFGCPRE